MLDRFGNQIYNFDVIQVGQLTVHQIEGNTMSGSTTLQKQCKGTPIVLANVFEKSGTPYFQPANVVGNVNGTTLTISVYGTSYFTGQGLDIRYLVLDLA